MIPVFVPPMVYLRQKLGERIIPELKPKQTVITMSVSDAVKMIVAFFFIGIISGA
jgi:hypothetical protein